MASKNSSIPKVCQENWLQLNADEKVRFCNLCQKNVFDFSDNNTLNSDKFVCLRHATELKEVKKNKFVDKITELLIKKK